MTPIRRAILHPSNPYKRKLIGLWLGAYVAWFFAAPWLLARRGEPELAGWCPLWLVPTMIAGGVIGIAALVSPNRFTVALLGIVSICHIAVGLGLFPK